MLQYGVSDSKGTKDGRWNQTERSQLDGSAQPEGLQTGGAANSNFYVCSIIDLYGG